MEQLHAVIDRCLAGEQSAMLQLVNHYRGQVFGLCYRMLGQKEDAEDAAQETFIRVLKSLKNWDRKRDFDPWVLAIAANRCRTALASRMRRPTSQVLPELPAKEEGLQAAGHLAEEVDLALAGLREEYRQAFVLFHEQELGYAEIAEALECPIGTVKTWVYRARREMIDFLKERGVVEEPRHAVR